MKIATVGDNCMDVYSDGQTFPGGNSVNVAVYCKRLGHDASYIGAVGDDENGTKIVDALKLKGVDVSHVKVLDGETAITRVEIENGDRVFVDYKEGVMSNLKLTQEDISFLATHDMVVSAIWGNIEKQLGEIRKRGVRVAFDFSDQTEHPIIDIAITETDYAFFAHSGDDDDFIRNYLKQMQAKGPKVTIATLGEHGSIAWNGSNFVKCGIVPCNVVDTMGAGDSFIAGFLCGILQDLPLLECMQQGAKNSGETIGYVGAW